MQYRNHKHVPYNPMSYSGIRMVRQESNTPHAQFRVTYYPATKTKPERMAVSGCQCVACLSYLRTIAHVNYPRFLKMIEANEAKYFRPIALPDHVHARNMLNKTLARFNFPPMYKR